MLIRNFQFDFLTNISNMHNFTNNNTTEISSKIVCVITAESLYLNKKTSNLDLDTTLSRTSSIYFNSN